MHTGEKHNFSWQIFSGALAHFQPRTAGVQLSRQGSDALHAWTCTSMNHLGAYITHHLPRCGKQAKERSPRLGALSSIDACSI